MNENSPLDQTPWYLLGEINAKVTHLVTSLAIQREEIKEEHEQIHERITAQGKRITELEQRHWRTAGIISLIPIGLSIAGLGFAYIAM